MTIVVDGDFLCYYQAHALQSKGGKLEDSTMVEYVRGLMNQLAYMNKRLLNNNVGQFVFCFDDGRSWRYGYLESLGIKYKDRDDSKRPLTSLFGDYRRFFRKTLIDYKFTVIGIPGYEADDCIHLCVNEMKDSEVGIYTGDSDAQQELSSTEKKEVFIVNPLDKDKMSLYRTAHQPPKRAIGNADFFDEEPPSRYIDTANNVRVIDPAHKLFVKVISGDNTDTIPSAFKHAGGTIGETRAETLYRECGFDKLPGEHYAPGASVEQIKKMFVSREERMEFIKWVISTTKLKILDKAALFEQGLYRNIKCILLDDVTYEEAELENVKHIVNVQLTKSSVGANLTDIFRGTDLDLSKGYTYKY